tara:strand:- start:4047 stop:4532 length:486 start_codon:yes stop_codon:yes gene_type:complete
MRKQFAEKLHREMGANENIYFLTGDLGYGLWDKIKIDYPDRFYNCGSSEQLMLGIASGLAMEGKVPVVYSITPFLLYRPFEFIRNYVDHERLPVKLIGGGRDKDYGYLGFSHWSEEDRDVMSCFKNIESLWPESVKEMLTSASCMFNENISKPQYLSLRRK